MVAGQQLVIQLQGGGPYGFRLLGGDTNPITIAKIRPSSKAQQAGLLEGDVLLAVNGISCRGLSHGTVTALTEFEDYAVSLLVMRGKTSTMEVESVFSSLDPAIRRMSEQEAATLVACRGVKSNNNNWSSEAHTGSPHTFSSNDAGTRFTLQLPPAGRLKQSIVTNSEPKIVIHDPFSTVWNAELQENLSFPQASTTSEQQPGYYSRQEHSFNDGDVTRHTVEEVKTEKFGGTTMTKVTKKKKVPTATLR